MQKSNQQTGINYRTQRLASCQELLKSNGGLVVAAIFPHWCGSTAGVTTSPDTTGTAVLSEERSLQGLRNILVQHPLKKTPNWTANHTA